MEKKIVIGGCRDFENYEVFKEYVDKCLERIRKEYKITIISGHCSGADRMAEQYAEENGFDLEIFRADWDKYGRAAGPIRNRKMVEECNYVIAFWDKQSRGTRSLISCAKELKKEIRIKIIT